MATTTTTITLEQMALAEAQAQLGMQSSSNASGYLHNLQGWSGGLGMAGGLFPGLPAPSPDTMTGTATGGSQSYLEAFERMRGTEPGKKETRDYRKVMFYRVNEPVAETEAMSDSLDEIRLEVAKWLN